MVTLWARYQLSGDGWVAKWTDASSAARRYRRNATASAPGRGAYEDLSSSRRPPWSSRTPATRCAAIGAPGRRPSPECRRHVELDAVDERVVVDRAGVGGPRPQRLPIRLTRRGHVLVGHRREGQHLEVVDLEDHARGAVPAADLDLRSGPQPDRDGDLAARHRVAKISAEHHPDTLGRSAHGRRPRRLGSLPTRRSLMRDVVVYSLLSLDGVAEEPGDWMFEADEDVITNLAGVISSQDEDSKPFFVWWNSSRMHIWTHLKPASQGVTGSGDLPRWHGRARRPCRPAARSPR